MRPPFADFADRNSRAVTLLLAVLAHDKSPTTRVTAPAGSQREGHAPSRGHIGWRPRPPTYVASPACASPSGVTAGAAVVQITPRGESQRDFVGRLGAGSVLADGSRSPTAHVYWPERAARTLKRWSRRKSRASCGAAAARRLGCSGQHAAADMARHRQREHPIWQASETAAGIVAGCPAARACPAMRQRYTASMGWLSARAAATQPG